MSDYTLILIIFTLLSIIPALAMGVVLWLRIHTIRQDSIGVVAMCKQSERDVQRALTMAANIDANTHDHNARILGLDQRINSLGESHARLQNKLNSRDRTLRKREEADDTDKVNDEEIPGTEQQVLELLTRTPVPSVNNNRPTRRPFGQMPSAR